MVQIPETGRVVRGIRRTNERAALSTVGALSFVVAPVTVSMSPAPLADRTMALSMPGDCTPAPAGQAEPPVVGLRSVSSANSAMGMVGSTSVFQSTRQNVASEVAPTATRKMSAPFRDAAPAG